VRFSVQTLKTAALAALSEHKAEWDSATQAAADKREDEENEFAARHSEAWLAASKVIARKARRGEAILKSDLPADFRWRGNIAYYERLSTTPVYYPPSDLVQLLAVLDLVDGDFVHNSGLRDLGVTMAGLRRAVAHMSPVEK